MKAAFLFLLLFPLAVSAQDAAGPDSVRRRTVAIRSARRSFFPDFTIDSLVRELNRRNRNPEILYCNSTEDDSPTGFYADFLVDVDFDVRYAHLEAPPPTEARLQFLQMPSTGSRGAGAGTQGNSPAYNPGQRADFKMKKGEGVCTVKILERRKNEKLTREYLRATSESDDLLQQQLAAGAVRYLLYRFGK
ncbi:MAG: hypothetical protein EOO16_18205 [Chitinophagaceae bacterium]|nr:MAG: hypothetical protein EOO16_18205 [Chitinophagaceae bacterium]